MNDEVNPLVDEAHGHVGGEHRQGQGRGERESEDAGSRNGPRGDNVGGIDANVVERQFVVGLVDVVPEPVLGL